MNDHIKSFLKEQFEVIICDLIYFFMYMSLSLIAYEGRVMTRFEIVWSYFLFI